MSSIIDQVECTAMEDHFDEEEENEDAANAASESSDAKNSTEKRYIVKIWALDFE
jgi:hypothetical protein